MKNFEYIIHKAGLSVILGIIITVSLFSCTDDFEKYNRNPGEPTKEDLSAGHYLTKVHFPTLMNYAYPVQENAYQLTQNFIGDVYGRYLSISKSGWNNHFQTFNCSDTWLYTPIKDTYGYIARSFFEVEKITKDDSHYQHIYSLAKILKVTAFQRLTDMYGPLPYSKLSPGNLMAEYDDQETVYKKMFEELDEAIAVLTAHYKANPKYKEESDVYDKIYGNDYKKWVVYANTLKLRMAIRIRFADPVLARQKAESAIHHEFGVMNTNEDNAYNSFQPNGLFKVAVEWKDARACADIICYMKGYNDPRLSKYFTKSEPVNDHIGLRSGIVVASTEVAGRYSTATTAANDRLLIMPASESYFLRAEGALLGWDMGGSAKDFYENGIKISFAQWKAEGVDRYLDNGTSKPDDYPQPAEELLLDKSVNYAVKTQSSATIKWDEAVSTEKKLEKIMTQKWIAMYPLGQEAWSEQRRTGYPAFFPVLVNLNEDAQLRERLASRIPYPDIERQKQTYGKVLEYLGGKDNYSTKLWWDKNPNKKER